MPRWMSLKNRRAVDGFVERSVRWVSLITDLWTSVADEQPTVRHTISGGSGGLFLQIVDLLDGRSGAAGLVGLCALDKTMDA